MLEFPAWDCLPYDRVSPGADASARRVEAMLGMIALGKEPHRAIVLTTANALLQRVPPPGIIEAQGFRAAPGSQVDMNELIRRLESSGFERVPTVREVGEFAVRGGILDLFAPGSEEAVRLDFFGDTLESIRAFDTATQRTISQRRHVSLQAMTEVTLTPETIGRFRRNYIEAFGAPARDDALYAAISEGRRFAGMEHWLPFYYERLDTLFGYLPGAPVVFDHLARQAIDERHAVILDYYEARRQQGGGALKDAVPYKPAPPGLLYLTPDDVSAALPGRAAIEFSPFGAPDAGPRKVFHAGARAGRSFAEERADPNANVFEAAVGHVGADARRRPARGHRRLDGRLARAACPDSRRAPAWRHEAGRDARRRRPARLGRSRTRRAAARNRLRNGSAGGARRAGHPRRPPGAPLQEAQARRRLHRRGGVAVGRRHRRACRPRHRALRRAEIDRGGRRPA